MTTSSFDPLRLQDENQANKEKAVASFIALGEQAFTQLLEAHKAWNADLRSALLLGEKGYAGLLQMVAAGNEHSRAALGALTHGDAPPSVRLDAVCRGLQSKDIHVVKSALEEIARPATETAFLSPQSIETMRAHLPLITGHLIGDDLDALSVASQNIPKILPLLPDLLVRIQALTPAEIDRPITASMPDWRRRTIETLRQKLEGMAILPRMPTNTCEGDCLNYLEQVTSIDGFIGTIYRRALALHGHKSLISAIEQGLNGNINAERFRVWIRLYGELAAREKHRNAHGFLATQFNRKLDTNCMEALIRAASEIQAESLWPNIKQLFGKSRGAYDSAIFAYTEKVRTPETESFLIEIALSEDPNKSWTALSALNEFRSSATVATFCQILDNPKIGRKKANDYDRVHWAMVGLEKIGDSAAVPSLIREMKHALSGSIAALRRIAHASAYDAMLDAAKGLVKNGRHLDYTLLGLSTDFINAFDYFFQIGAATTPEIQTLAQELRRTRWDQLKPIEKAYFDRYYPPDQATQNQVSLNRSFEEAVRAGDRTKMEALLAAGADINARIGSKEDSNTMLHVAAEADQVQAIQCLLEHGLPVDIKNGRKRTPLGSAAKAGNKASANLLLSAGGNPLVVDGQHLTPLSWAEINRLSETVKLMKAWQPPAKGAKRSKPKSAVRKSAE